MLKIKSIISYLRQHWVITFIALVIVLFIISIVLRLLTPVSSLTPITPQITQQNFDGTHTTFTSVTYVGNPPEFPSAIPLVEVESSSLQLDAVRDQLVETFALAQSPTSPNIWEGAIFTLFWNESENWLQLSRNFLPEEATGTVSKITPDNALSVSKEFVNKYLPNLKLSPQTSSLQFASGSEGFSSEITDNATAIRVPFTYSVNNIPFYYKRNTDYPFLIDVDGKQEVSQALIYHHFINFKPIKTLPTLTLEQAIAELREGGGSIISAFNGVGGEIPLSRLADVQFNSVKLEYRVDDALQTAYPFFRFSGSALATDNRRLSIEAITPAIQTTSPSAQ
jgi:hypothetical protein